MFTHSVFASMLRCVHGLLFNPVTLYNDPPRCVERAWCVHCDKEHKHTSWFAQCCYDVVAGRYENINILNNGYYCMLCDNCMSKFSDVGQLTEGDYRADFNFVYKD